MFNVLELRYSSSLNTLVCCVWTLKYNRKDFVKIML